ncbi:MAG: hypothetical protein QXH20_02570 [Candidatus Bathyarchaeia archaeon]
MVEKKCYDRKVITVGGSRPSRYLNITRILPPEWRYVRIWKPKIEGDKAILVIECLYSNQKAKKEA